MNHTNTAPDTFNRLRDLFDQNDQEGLPYLFVHVGGDEREVELRLEVDGTASQGVLKLHSDGTWSFVPCAE